MGVRMSAALSVPPELPSSSKLATFSTSTSSRTARLDVAGGKGKAASPADPNLYSPINGVVGHTFIRLCLWVDLLSSWKKRNSVPPAGQFLNFAASEIEADVVPHAAAS